MAGLIAQIKNLQNYFACAIDLAVAATSSVKRSVKLPKGACQPSLLKVHAPIAFAQRRSHTQFQLI